MSDYCQKPCFEQYTHDDHWRITECLEVDGDTCDCTHLDKGGYWADCNEGGKSGVLSSYRDEEMERNRLDFLFPQIKKALNSDQLPDHHQIDMIIEFIEIQGWKIRDDD